MVTDDAEIVVVGGGAAGLCAAAGLAGAGARVLCVEAGQFGAGASGSSGGQLLAGVVEAPHRLVASLGEARTQELFDLTRSSAERLANLGLLERSGLTSLALDAREPGELERSHAVLEAMGIDSRLLPAEEVERRTGLDGAGPALWSSLGGRVHPPTAIRRLADAARDAGATLLESSRVARIDEDSSGLVVHAGTRRVRTEMVVWASGIATRELEPSLAELILPVREQALAVAADDPGSEGARAGYGYTWFEPRGSEGWIGGCRWATPHLEVGESEAAVVPAVQRRLDDVAGRLTWGGAPPRRWAWIEAHTCDGLPLVGPVPGSNRLVVCTGFCGNDWGLAPGAAALVTEGLMGERAEASGLFAPSRLL